MDDDRFSAGAFIGGVFIGIPAVFGLFIFVWFSSFIFDGFHPAAQTERIAALSVGTDLYWLCLLLGLVVGLWAVFASKMRWRVRSFLIGLALPPLGLLAMCSYLGITDLISGKHS